MFCTKSFSLVVIWMMVASEVVRLANAQSSRRGRGRERQDLDRRVRNLHSLTYDGSVVEDFYNKKYVNFGNNNDIGNERNFYPFAKRSIPDAPVQAEVATISDLKCATLEACLGGTEAPLRHVSQNSGLMNSMDYLLRPAFRVGFFGRSKDYCHRIYADCDDNANLSER